MKLLLRDDNGPLLPGLAKHLLCLQHLPAVEDALPDHLRRRRRSVDYVDDAVDVGDGDLRRLLVGPPLDLQLARGVGLLGLAGRALGLELHARGRAGVKGIKLDPNLQEKFQHLFLFGSEL